MELQGETGSLSPRSIPTEAIFACKRGHLKQLQELLENNSVFNVKNFCRWSRACGFYEDADTRDVIVHRELVRIAALNQHMHIVNYLLELGALGSSPDKVVRAIELGAGEALQLMIELEPSIVYRMRYNSKFYGDTYQGVCFKGLPRWKNRMALEILYVNGADPNLESDCMSSAVRSGDPEVVELVKTFGCDDDERWYLELAASSGLTEMVQYLLDTGADIDSSYPAENYTWTALHGAAFMGHVEMVTFLLQNGANPKVLSEYRSPGRSPVRLSPAQVARGPRKDAIRELLTTAMDSRFTESPSPMSSPELLSSSPAASASSSRSSSFSTPPTPKNEPLTEVEFKGKLVPTPLDPLIEVLDLNE